MPTYYPPGTRKGNRFIIARGRINGRQYEISTDTTDPDAAQEYWIEYRARVRKQDRDAPNPETATFRDAVKLYENTRTLSKSEARYVKKLKKHLGHRMLAGIRPGDLIAAANALYPNALPQTKNRQAITPAASILHCAADNGLCVPIRVNKLKADQPFRPIAYPEELDRLIKATKGPMRTLLLTLAYQGWRITETLMVRRERFDPDNQRVQRWVTKSREWRWTPLDPGVCSAWKKLPKRGDGFLFPWRDRHNFYRALNPILDKLKMEYSPHRSRRGFATALIEEGADLKSIMEAGGWLDIKSVAIYADANVDQQRRTIGKLRGRARGKCAKPRKRKAS